METLKPIDREAIWVCGCGGKTWHLMFDGRVECRSCGNIPEGITWKLPLTGKKEQPQW